MMCKVFKAVLPCTALLALAFQALSEEADQIYAITDYAQLTCEVQSSTVELVITSNSHTPSGTKLSILGSGSIQTSLAPNSRFVFQLMGADLPLKLEITTTDKTLLFYLNSDCQLETIQMV